MSKSLIARLGAASGIAYVVSLLALNSVEQRTSLVHGGEVLALLLFVPFLVYLCALVRDAGWLAAVALSAGLVALAVKLAGVLPTILAERGELDRSLEAAFIRLGEVSFIVSMPPLGICLAAVGLAALSTSALPRWLAWAGLAVAPLLVANGFDLGAEFGPAFLLFMLWTLVCGVVLLRREMSTAAPVLAAHAR